MDSSALNVLNGFLPNIKRLFMMKHFLTILTLFLAIALYGQQRPAVLINSPASLAQPIFNIGTANWGLLLTDAIFQPITGNVVIPDDGSSPTGDGCTSFINGAAMAGNICLVDRGTCAFAVKCQNAQDAGAIAVIICNNQPAGIINMSATAPTDTLCKIMIEKSICNSIKAHLANGPVNVTIDNAFGQPVREEGLPINNGLASKSLDVSGLPAGMYCLKVEVGGEQRYLKFLKI